MPYLIHVVLGLCDMMYMKKGKPIFEEGDYVIYKGRVRVIHYVFWMRGRHFPSSYTLKSIRLSKNNLRDWWDFASPEDLKIAPSWMVSLELLDGNS